MKRVTYILLFLLLSITIFAQRAPITVTTILTPPYTTSLSTMAESGSTRLMVNLLVNDVTITEIPVKLHIKMESSGITIESIPTQAVRPMFLGGGEARVLTGDDFAEYLNLNNLNFKGFSKEAYIKNGQLPAGLWKFSVSVRHFYTNKTISNIGTVTAWITSYKPPVLTSPKEGENAPSNAALPLTFSWQASKHTGGTAAIMYRFEMWERRIEGVPAQAVAASVPPIYTTETAGLTATVLPATLALEPGMKYCWRVTAYDPSGMVTIENKGESEVRTFQYLEKCPEVCGLTIDIKDDTGYASWEENRVHLGGYNFEFYDDEGTCHKTLWGSSTRTAGIGGEYGKTWHVRVQGLCRSGVEGPWSDWVDFKIPDAFKPLKDENGNTYECGREVPERVITNFELIDNIQKGDTLEDERGTTKYIVHSAIKNEDGSFRGLSYMKLSIWGVKVLGEYNNMKVNTDGVIIGRYAWQSVKSDLLVADPEAIEKWADELALEMAGATYNNTIKDTIVLKYSRGIVPFETIAREGTKYYAVTSDGHKEEITSFINGQKRVMVKDGDGHELVIDKDGNVMGVEEYTKCGGSSKLLSEHNAYRDSTMATSGNVKFSKVKDENYGFDEWRGADYDKDVYDNFNGYRPTYIGAQKQSSIKVKASQTKGIRFITERGVPIIAQNDTLQLTIGTTGKQAVYAYRDSTLVGKLCIQAYDPKEVKVHVVRVNNGKQLELNKIADEVNRIYSSAVVHYTFDELEPITIEYANKQHFVHGGKGTFQNYNADQKTAIKALPKTADPNDYYLFFTECYNRLDTAGNMSPEAVNGYMPVGRHYGFIYNEYTNARTIAHELGHGTNSLHHTFSAESETFRTTEKTDNLMDYNGGTQLNHKQWQWAHEKHRNVLGFLDDEGESELIADAVNALSDYEYAYIKKCSDEQNNNETLSTKVERYKVIGKKLSGENTIETINLNYEESGLVTFIAEDFTDAILIFDNGNLVNACEPAPPIDIDVCSISTIDNQSSLIEKIDAAVQNCLLSYLTEILQKLNAISSSNSIVGYTINNNSYRLVDGQIQKSPLSSDDINNGNWEDGSIEQILRLEKNADGIIQVKAFGFHKDLKPQGYDWNGNSIKYFVDLSQLSSDIRATTNKYLKQNNVTTFDQKPNSVPDDVFPGNQTIVLDGNSSCVSLILKGLDISKEFLKTAEFEREVYQTDLQSEIKLPAIATGTTESIARSVTDITSVVSFGYDIIFDDEVRRQTIEGFGAIKDQVIEDPSMLFPLLRDVVIEEFTGATYDQYTELTADSTDSGRCNHLSSKIAVRSAASLFAGGKVVAKLPEISAKVAIKIADAKAVNRFASLANNKELLSTLKKRIHDLPDEGQQFLDDFADANDDVLKRFVEKPELVDAWNVIKSSHPADCKKINVLQKVDDLRKLPGREKVGFTDDVITNIKGVFYGADNVSTIPYEEVLETCSDFVKSVSNNNIDLRNFSKIIGDLSKGQSFTAGAEWTVRYIGLHGGEFAGKKLNFEVLEEVSDKIRRVDMEVVDGKKTIFYEFKSVKDVPPANFLAQFGKDLANSEVSDLSQIKWIFDGKKVTQQQLTDAIKKAIDELPDDIVQKWNLKNEKARKQLLDIFKVE